MIKGIEHLGIAAENPDQLAQWYVRHLDMTIIRDNGQGTIFIAAPCGSVVELYPAKTNGERSYDNYTSGIRHLAIEVENFHQEYDRLLENGVEIAAEPVIREDLKLVLFRDGEGNLCHLIERQHPLS
ncbi:MAG: Glyoxalase/bleomycin resistance protein/dioxygenase [Paenibacillaceae bacterium]|jgi:catechol 2,3-dioxygenase-like lactoylglutathione lyase family enzyme|nr:Glyoxalase/bleomycin resistance protein/dioxygenase [Paenibacillaceae bacterium]